jgi:hypothetical protein
MTICNVHACYQIENKNFQLVFILSNITVNINFKLFTLIFGIKLSLGEIVWNILLPQM